MNLLDTRKQYNLSQMEAASILGVPLRTYIRYEKDDNYGDAFKRKTMIDIIISQFCQKTPLPPFHGRRGRFGSDGSRSV